LPANGEEAGSKAKALRERAKTRGSGEKRMGIEIARNYPKRKDIVVVCYILLRQEDCLRVSSISWFPFLPEMIINCPTKVKR
jgi:hypothetical protein